MIRRRYILWYNVLLLFVFTFPHSAHAHEAYVLDHNYFWDHLRAPTSWQVWNALSNPHNLRIAITVAIGVLLALTLNYFFRKSRIGEKITLYTERFSTLGSLVLRSTIAIALFFSAYTWSFLGPELSLHTMPLAQLLRGALFVVSIFIGIGLFTELSALLSLIIFSIGFFTFGTYIFTYLNYVGELIALLLFGTRTWSLDSYIFGPLKRFQKWKNYEPSIIRIFYGLALVYAAITVKFLHPDLTEHVVTTWHLTNFHLLFPSDPLLVALGAGLAELAVGIFILIGFELHVTILVTLFYISLSLVYFRESVWPHLLLYGISLYLLTKPEIFTVDHILFPEKKGIRKKKRLSLWKRPFLAHR